MEKECIRVKELVNINRDTGFLGNGPLRVEFPEADRESETYENIKAIPNEYLGLQVLKLDMNVNNEKCMLKISIA